MLTNDNGPTICFTDFSDPACVGPHCTSALAARLIDLVAQAVAAQSRRLVFVVRAR